MKSRIIISLLVFSFFLIGCNTTTPEVAEETATNNEEQASGNTITIAADGFSPKTLSVKAGTTVTFVNEDANEHW